MKKLLLFVLMMVAMTATAQETNDSIQTIEMNRTFSVGGKALMCLRSAEAGKNDLKALTWTLKNDRVGDKNFVVLDVKNEKTGTKEVHQSWSDGVFVRLHMKNGKPTMYELYDDMFSHLRILDLGKNVSVIMFYSELLKK